MTDEIKTLVPAMDEIENRAITVKQFVKDGAVDETKVAIRTSGGQWLTKFVQDLADDSGVKPLIIEGYAHDFYGVVKGGAFHWAFYDKAALESATVRAKNVTPDASEFEDEDEDDEESDENEDESDDDTEFEQEDEEEEEEDKGALYDVAFRDQNGKEISGGEYFSGTDRECIISDVQEFIHEHLDNNDLGFTIVFAKKGL